MLSFLVSRSARGWYLLGLAAPLLLWTTGGWPVGVVVALISLVLALRTLVQTESPRSGLVVVSPRALFDVVDVFAAIGLLALGLLGATLLTTDPAASLPRFLGLLFGVAVYVQLRASFRDGADVRVVVTCLSGCAALVATVGFFGTAWLDQRFSTGEAKPVRKGRGEQVSAGAIVQQGRLYLQVEELEQRLLSSTLRDLLEQSVDQPTPIRQAGEKSAEQMAPRMLLTFAFTLPFLGANHAAAFLTTGFGNHLRTLGPNTVRNFLIPAAEQGIVIKQARALEVANLVNVLIFDAQVLTDPVARTHAPQVIAALRQRPRLPNRTAPQRLAVYVFVPANAEALGRQLTTECGLDDYLAATTPAERAATIAGLQAGGRTVCYIGAGAQDAIVLEKAQVSIAWRGAATLATSRAQVVLLDRDLHQLLTFFDLAATFAIKQGFNLVVPIMLDLVDIGTTVFMGLNLGYSILFTYGGLWLGALYANLRPRPAAIQAAPVTPPPTPLLLPHI